MLCLLVVAVLGADAADMIVDPEVKRVMKILKTDPPVRAVQQAALNFFRVNQGDIEGYRSSSRLRALLPSVNGGYNYGDDRSDQLSTDRAVFGGGLPFDPTNPQVTDVNNGTSRGYSAGASWDLGTLVFNPSEIDAYSLVGIHEDVMKQVTRIYYTRQHNLLALALDPPDSPRAKAGLILRTQELDSMLDAYTGGAWSKLKAGESID
ncbi:MAG: hypothetical protein AAFU77_10245 [Myxococcota bacterium]